MKSRNLLMKERGIPHIAHPSINLFDCIFHLTVDYLLAIYYEISTMTQNNLISVLHSYAIVWTLMVTEEFNGISGINECGTKPAKRIIPLSTIVLLLSCPNTAIS